MDIAMDCGKQIVQLLIALGLLITSEAAFAQQLNPPRQVGGQTPPAQNQITPPSTNPSTPAQSSSSTANTPSTNNQAQDNALPAVNLIGTSIVTSSTEAIYVFDLENYLQLQPENKTWQYDVINLVTTLQGLVNRQEPLLFIFYVRERLSSSHVNVDKFWLQELRGPGQYLCNHRIVPIETLEDLLAIFREYYSSLVLWDPNLPATGNVALTICGADGLLPVRFDKSANSLYNQISVNGPQITSTVQLTGKFSGVDYIPDTNEGAPSTKTPKTDAYMWAKLFYLDSGLCSPSYLGFFLDPYDWDPRTPGYQYPDLQQCSIVNRDFYISKKAFFVDLDPWNDETATDTSDNPFNKGIDLFMLNEILKSAYQQTPGDERILKVGGFVPWWIKYSDQYIHPGGRNGFHSRASTAQEFVGHISRYSGILDADSAPLASIANTSVFQHIPTKERYFQNPVPPRRILENKNYLLFSIGDFRSSAQLYQTIPSLWQESMRGVMPIAWALSPILSERVPHIFDYLYRTRTQNDYFVSGAPGAGLCYINRFLPSARPDASNAEIVNPNGEDTDLTFWERMSQRFYIKYDLHASLAADLSREMRASTFTSDLQRAFTSFSPQGVGSIKPFESPLVDNLIPFVREKGVFIEKLPPMDITIERIARNSKEGEPTFHIYRFNNANPTTLFLLYQRLQQEHPEFNYEAIDPFSFFYLKRQKDAGNDPGANFLLPNFISNTIPREMKVDEYYPSNVVLRNDGWDTWNPPEMEPNRGYRLTYRWFYEGEQEPETGWHDAYVKEPVYPGQQTVLNLNIQAPSRSANNPPLFRLVLVFGQENVRESYITEEMRIVVE